MSDDKNGAARQPGVRERLRPVELLVLSLVMAVFVGLIVLMSTRDWTLTAVFFGIAFIVALIGIALFGLAKPEAPRDADEQHPTKESDGDAS